MASRRGDRAARSCCGSCSGRHRPLPLVGQLVASRRNGRTVGPGYRLSQGRAPMWKRRAIATRLAVAVLAATLVPAASAGADSWLQFGRDARQSRRGRPSCTGARCMRPATRTTSACWTAAPVLCNGPRCPRTRSSGWNPRPIARSSPATQCMSASTTMPPTRTRSSRTERAQPPEASGLRDHQSGRRTLRRGQRLDLHVRNRHRVARVPAVSRSDNVGRLGS